jgi:2'-5' RNA ligase
MNDADQDQTTTDNEKWRLFSAIPLDEPVRQLLRDVQDEFRSEGWPLRWVDPDLMHITIRFFGDTPVKTVDELKRVLRTVARRGRPTLLTTGQIGAFPSMDEPRVMWIGLEGRLKSLESIADLTERVAQDIGFKPERRRFQGHITVARLRDGKQLPESFRAVCEDLTLPAVNVSADRYQLIRSVLSPQGPTYTVLEEWPIGDGIARTYAESGHG